MERVRVFLEWRERRERKRERRRGRKMGGYSVCVCAYGGKKKERIRQLSGLKKNERRKGTVTKAGDCFGEGAGEGSLGCVFGAMGASSLQMKEI